MVSFHQMHGVPLSQERFLAFREIEESKSVVLVGVPDSLVTLIQHNQYAIEAHFGYPGPQNCENTNPRENKAPCPSGGLYQG